MDSILKKQIDLFDLAIKKDPSYKFNVDLYARFLDRMTEWLDRIPTLKPLFQTTKDPLTLFVLNPTQVSFEIVSSFISTMVVPLLQEIKSYCDTDFHVEHDLVYHVGRKVTGQLRLSVEFPFKQVPSSSSTLCEVEEIIAAFDPVPPVQTFKSDFTPCCTKYRFQTTYRWVPKYDGDQVIPKDKVKVCDCGVVQEKHRLNCAKVWWKCHKCAVRKEMGHQFCIGCGERNADHTKVEDCLCTTTLNNLSADTLKTLYKKHVEPGIEVAEMSQRQYQMVKLRQALVTRTVIVPDIRGAVARAKKHIPHALQTQVWREFIGLEKGMGLCFCCETHMIYQRSFECGHVVAESRGGKTDVANLRPICSSCNKSMQTKNLFEFKQSLCRP